MISYLHVGAGALVLLKVHFTFDLCFSSLVQFAHWLNKNLCCCIWYWNTPWSFIWNYVRLLIYFFGLVKCYILYSCHLVPVIFCQASNYQSECHDPPYFILCTCVWLWIDQTFSSSSSFFLWITTITDLVKFFFKT